MTAVVVVGAQWGDEGKGKIVDILTEHADMVVRYGGGPNAGHTLVVGEERFVVRLIPSGILREQTTCVLAQGMAIDPVSLVSELDELAKRGLVRGGVIAGRQRSGARHPAVPRARRWAARAGTRRAGHDQARRRAVLRGQGGAPRDPAGRSCAICPVPRRSSSAPSCAGSRRFVPSGASHPSWPRSCKSFATSPRESFRCSAETSSLVERAVRDGKRVLFEGAQGTLLDIDHGTYPFVTSSSATAGGACTGTGVGPSRIDFVVGLVKAYCTRVGGGPFPTELSNELGERLRKRGDEYGSVTGRPRRTGWLDLPALRYAVRVNGLDGLALTKLDVLTGLGELKVCTSYRTPSGTTEDFPIDDAEHAVPVYESLPGWEADLSSARTLSALPEAARRYIERIERDAGCPVVLVSIGSRRDETIALKDPFGA